MSGPAFPQHITTVCFTAQDLALFSAASHDRNPLHLSEEYARATPYGEPVVFGILGALAALGQLAERKEKVLQRVELEFRNPLTVGVPYRVKVDEPSTDRAFVRLYDAARLMLKATFTFLSGPKQAQANSIEEAAGPTEAEDRQSGSFRAGDCLKGIYGPAARQFQQLIEHWGLHSKGATATQIAAMMWASFVVGMKLPGKRAMFWRLMLDFHPEDGNQEGTVFIRADDSGS